MNKAEEGYDDYDYLHIRFDPSRAEWNDKALGNIIPADALTIDYIHYDENDDDDKEYKNLVEAAKKSKPAYLLIKREYGKDLHYLV